MAGTILIGTPGIPMFEDVLKMYLNSSDIFPRLKTIVIFYLTCDIHTKTIYFLDTDNG